MDNVEVPCQKKSFIFSLHDILLRDDFPLLFSIEFDYGYIYTIYVIIKLYPPTPLVHQNIVLHKTVHDAKG